MTTELKQRCKATMDEAQAQFLATGQAMPVLRERTSVVDAAVCEAFAATLTQVLPEGIALLAVGGYGRRELFPHSDVDLLLLVRKTPSENGIKDALSEFLRILWDSGLRVSHSVRTIEECCQVTEGNFELTVSLLDERLLAGDRTLYTQMRERFSRFLQTERRDLVRRLCRMTRSRQARFHDTIFRLEPDVKDTPGGLRDLHATRWLRLLRGEEPDIADPRPIEFLFAVRCFLHFRAGRDQNNLSFEMQDEAAAAAFSAWHDPAEWMRAWFRTASAVFRKCLYELEVSEASDRSLLVNFRDWRSRLSNSDFTVSRDLLFLRNPNDLESDSKLILRLFQFVARHGVRPASQTEQRVATHLFRTPDIVGAQPPGPAFWKELLSLPHAALALRTMTSTGFLVAVLPVWERIEHRVVRDFYHQYTVDEHTMVALEVLQDLRRADNPHEQRFREILEESASDIWLLNLALLLHDIGKGSGKDHSLESLRLAGEFLTRMGMTGESRETVLFLVEDHLALNSAVQGKDLQDPATARSLATQVKTIERLRLLALLSFADVSAVNSTAMTPWKMEQLWRLYRVVHRELTGGLTQDRVVTPESAYGEVSARLAEYLEGLPERYLWTHTKAEAEAHCDLFEKSRDAGAALHLERREGFFYVNLVTMDRPFLFASYAGALASFGLNILKAEAFSNRQGYAVDSFIFADPLRNLDLNPPEVERLRTVLRNVALGQVRTEDLLKQRPSRSSFGKRRVVEPQVGVDQTSSEVATILEVVAQDRPGLLYLLASAISRSGCNIEVVLVDTEAHKAIDVFHVTKSGQKLNEADSTGLRDALLAACVA